MGTLTKKLFILFLFLNGILANSQDKKDYFYINNEGNEIQLDPSEIEDYIYNIISLYENNGYPFSEAKLDNIKRNKANLVINKGERYTIDSLVIYGDTKLTEKQLFQLIRIRKGDIYNQKKLNDIDKKLSEIQYLKQSKKHEFVFHKNTTDIYFYLEKVPNNFIDGLIGFNSEEEKIKLNGYVNLQLVNLLNKGEKFQFNWKIEQEKFQKLENTTTIPSLFNSQLGSEFYLDIYRKYNEFTNTEKEISVFHLSRKNLRYKMSYQMKNSISENAEIGNSKIRNIGAGIGFKTQEIKIDCNGFVGKRHTNTTSDYLNLKLSTNYLFHFSERLQSNLNTENNYLFNNNLQENEMIFFGGTNSIKGFLEDQFTATKLHILGIDLNYKLDQNMNTSIFYQKCFYENEKRYSQLNSVGVGFDLKNNSGIVYLQYAIGISENQSFNFENGRIHIGLKNTF